MSIVHVLFALARAGIPGLDRFSLWQRTLFHTVVIALIQVLVRMKVLFSVIPR